MPNRTTVFLNVKNVEKSIRFYEGLGFKASNVSDDEATGEANFATLKLNGAELWIGAVSMNKDPAFQGWMNSGPWGIGVLPMVVVSNIQKVHESAKKTGAEIESPPVEDGMGWFMNVVDPDGYSIAFWQEARKARKPARAKPRSGSRARKASAARRKKR